jgi:hypothetical protein
MANFIKIMNNSFKLLSLKQQTIPSLNGINLQLVRALPHFIDIPKPGLKHKQYRRIVHYPEDNSEKI